MALSGLRTTQGATGMLLAGESAAPWFRTGTTAITFSTGQNKRCIVGTF
jgi:hypothetical protein